MPAAGVAFLQPGFHSWSIRVGPNLRLFWCFRQEVYCRDATARDLLPKCWLSSECHSQSDHQHLSGQPGMKLQSHFKRMQIDIEDGVHLLHVGEMEIWDGADLALLREGLFHLIERERCRAIAIDMTYVKYIPSGFFGMLVDWQEKRGVWFALTPPQPNVQRMLWFRRFFQQNAEGLFELQTEPLESMLPTAIDNVSCLAETAV